jgi:hypothetical protein
MYRLEARGEDQASLTRLTLSACFLRWPGMRGWRLPVVWVLAARRGCNSATRP